MDLTEAQDIKKRWQEHMEELYKKSLNELDNHHGMFTHLESDILECEVKWALGNIARNKFQLAKLEFHILNPLQFSSVQSLSHVRLFATP